MTLLSNELKSQTFEGSPKIQLKGKFKSNKLWLRWVVYDQDEWYRGLTNGYILKKYKIRGNNKSTEWSKIIMPVSKIDWPRSSDSSDIAGLYQLLYFTNEELLNELPQNPDGHNFAYSVENIKVIRHTYCLLAANSSFQSSILQGIAYEDLDIQPGAAYEYVLYTSSDSIPLPFNQNSIVKADLPPAMNFKMDEININFNWDGKIRFDTYHGYTVELSHNGNNFSSTNSGTLSNIFENGPGIAFRDSFYWQDSMVPGEDRWYRLRGVDYFGETNSPGPAVKIHAPERIPGPIALDYHISNNTSTINWYFDPKFEYSVSHFQIWEQDSLEGDKKLLIDNIHHSIRSYDIKNQNITKYYSIHLIRTENTISMSSFPMMVVPFDNVPPSQPSWISAACDSLGKVYLLWLNNPEPDLRGYRVFRSNALSNEFSQITYEPITDSLLIDSINLNTLSSEIYYKIAAEDNSGNLSTLSAPIKVLKYDSIPPAPPQIYQWVPNEKSIELHWYPSSSTDVSYSVLLRKSLMAEQWDEIKKLPTTDKITSIVDEGIHQDSTYQYTLVSVDYSGNHSALAEAVTARSLGFNKYPSIEIVQATYDSTANAIIFSWQYPIGPVAEFWIYRSHGGAPVTLAVTIDGVIQNWSDYSVIKGSMYIYRIKALMQNGRESFMSKPIVVDTR